jgi:uncharacterized membrane protein
MATENTQDQVATYAAEVRAELSDLPGDERDALLEDLEDHLAEVAAESEVPLAARLGSPKAYAAELRAAYGVAREQRVRRAGRLRRAGRAARAVLAGSAVYAAVRGFLPELRPAWWVLRAYLAMMMLAVLFRGASPVQPIPNPLSSRGLLQIILTAVAIVLSIRIGRLGAPPNRGLRTVSVGANGLIALAGLIALSTMGTAGYEWTGTATSGVSELYTGPPAAYAMGTLTNIYAYTLDGRTLNGVLLYDQDGRPLTLGGKGFEPATQNPVAADGQPVTNEYPLKQTHADGTPVLAPRVALPPFAPSPRPSASASPSPTP